MALRGRLEQELLQFSGTIDYHKDFTGLVYTDGIKYLAERAEAYWLINLVGSHQYSLDDVPFQVWRVLVREDSSARVSMAEDTGLPDRVAQEVPFTDFPLREFSFYCIDGIMLLKGEY